MPRTSGAGRAAGPGRGTLGRLRLGGGALLLAPGGGDRGAVERWRVEAVVTSSKLRSY